MKVYPGELWGRKLNVGGHEFGAKILRESEEYVKREVREALESVGKTKRSLLLVAPKKA